DRARRHPGGAGRRSRRGVFCVARCENRRRARRLGARRGAPPMNLVTRCPSCSTAFRVLPGQLAARNGQVRCGKCNTVFDGVGALVKGPQPAKLAEPAPAQESEDEPLPPFLAEPPASRRGPWPTLAVLAALALAAQILLHFRAEV